MIEPTPTERVKELEAHVADYRKSLSEAHTEFESERNRWDEHRDRLVRENEAMLNAVTDLEQRHEQDLKIIMAHNVTNGELRRQISLLQDTIVRIAHGRD